MAETSQNIFMVDKSSGYNSLFLVKKTLPEETLRHFLCQIGSAMDAMNKRAIMHRDLKPGNILLSYYGDFRSVNEVPGPLITFKLGMLVLTS